ncbi:lysine decarboxylase [Corallococcus sp. AB049A]|uniref:Orn/Lys/Arg family decarboxylase n=1 Tax=Corallococcus sp. AB049A TaxID=2316721 RepID=UPI000EA33746|nr:Orn/Lys/Arg decarboxylase N-terminal domain-containing protein [Corallococcus sp. AB049A]RKH50576.1 lysine decarboxylase [Corallococcus sp. AB050B]RKI75006.1 lysine decarboxylase [Corallococcus sp. AB049A]
MRHHALIVSPDTRADLRTTTPGAALQRIIDRLQERGFEVTSSATLKDGRAGLEASQDFSVVVLDWELIRDEAQRIEALFQRRRSLGAHSARAPEGLLKAGPRGESMDAHAVDDELLPYLKFLPGAPPEPTAPMALRALRSEGGALEHGRPLPETFREGFVSVELQRIRARNKELPLFIWTARIDLGELPLNLLKEIEGYIWKTEDSPTFIAGRLEAASRTFHERITPSFFGALTKYVTESNYSWHTPGHMGGIGFLKSAVGHGFHAFFGENMLRADLSVSVPQLGSLLDHSAVVGTAEAEAAQTFGAERTYFVTNGTSTSNQIVFHGTVNRGDVVLIDRNCHKTSMQAIVAIGCIPIYLNATTNELGIIGPVPASEFSRESIRRKIEDCPLIPAERKEHAARNLRLAVLTNSTYDGLCYDAVKVEQLLADLGVRNIMFDEAWSCYTRFHPFYARRHGMLAPEQAPSDTRPDAPRVFATQSTHKVLTALSQASMIHVRNVRDEEGFHERFNEAFMMHTSTSPQYTILASLDVASRTMALSGRSLVEEALVEALTFRDNMESISARLAAQGDWWFQVWQPPGQAQRTLRQLRAQEDAKLSEGWCLHAGESWHGFQPVSPAGEGATLLDPTKATLYTKDIPASVVANYLLREGIVVEKTGATSFLVLFTLGITRGKLGTLVSALFDFKQAYDENRPVAEVLPDAAKTPAARGGRVGLKDFCRALKEMLPHALPPEQLPSQVMLPSTAYEHIVSNTLERVPVSEAAGRVAAKILVPYPPAIPLVMPGERISQEVAGLLRDCERIANEFPGFGIDLHGIEPQVEANGRTRYFIRCVRT